MIFPLLITLIASASIVQADPTPTSPGPSDVFNEGSQCTFVWTPDATGAWKTMKVELMTGDNFNMIHLATIATLNGADPSVTNFSYPCPFVTPNAPIYFYQFSSPDVPQLYWTTRFAIADAYGNTVPAANPTQVGGVPIPWGIGALTLVASATATSTSTPGGFNVGGINGTMTIKTLSYPVTPASLSTTLAGFNIGGVNGTEPGSSVVPTRSSSPPSSVGASATDIGPQTTTPAVTSLNTSGAFISLPIMWGLCQAILVVLAIVVNTSIL